LGTLVSLLAACGCSSLDNCPEAQPAREITTGKTDKATLVYESAPANALDEFPAKTQLWFKHDLGVKPLIPKVYLSFSAIGTNDKGGGSITESAGNQALIDCYDANYIVVRNDTCEPDFHILVVAQGASPRDNFDACGDFPE
jgi:hypothetical protein